MPNAKVLESNKAIVSALADKLQNASSAVFVDYKGITVAQDTELRRKFREAGVEYSVVKNTLTRFAANNAGYNQFDEILNGTTSLACTTGDPIAPARIISEFAKRRTAHGLRRTPLQGRSGRPGPWYLPCPDLLSGLRSEPDLRAEGRRSRCRRGPRGSLIHHIINDTN